MSAVLLRVVVAFLNRLTRPQLAQVQSALFRPDPEGAAEFQRQWDDLTARQANSLRPPTAGPDA